MEKRKNCWIISTDKPSRLSNCHDNKLHLDDVRYLKNCQNIYITSDEEIKEGDWVLSFLENESYNTPFKIEETHFRCGFDFKEDFKKIILTTDPDLIKYGVQAISDKFLEWFVKNPSCEFITITRVEHLTNTPYRILFPKEEPNIISDWLEKNGDPEIAKQVEQEAIGLEAHEYSMQYVGTDKYTVSMLAIEFGYQLAQQERSYSEDDLREAYFRGWGTRERFDDLSPDIVYPKGLDYEEKQEYAFNLWFKQYKKK